MNTPVLAEEPGVRLAPGAGMAGGGLACIGLGEDGSTYLASCMLDPSARAQQPEHTDFSAAHWDWDADGVKGTAARMEQLAVHALLVQLHVPELVSEVEVPPPSGGKGFGGAAARGGSGESVRRPVSPVAPLLEWVEPELGGGESGG